MDLVDEEATARISYPKNELGVYRGDTVYLKTGKYGNYIEWGTNKKSMNAVLKNKESITLEDAINVIENKIKSAQPNLVREIDQNLSIRNGKYGDYIFFKTPRMTKPQFFKLNNFPDDYKRCSIPILKDWIGSTYNV